MAKPNSKDENEKTAPDRGNALAVRGPADFNQLIESMFRGFDQTFGQFFPSFPSLQPFSGFAPSADLVDHGDHYTLTADLPGFSKDEVDVRVDDQALELSAEKKGQKESRDKQSTRWEQTHSVFHQVMSIPEPLATSKVTGTMKNGVLELKLPKREPTTEGRARRVPLA